MSGCAGSYRGIFGRAVLVSLAVVIVGAQLPAARAQVNTEQFVDEIKESGTSGHFNLDLSLGRGNVDLLSVRTDFLLQYAILTEDETESLTDSAVPPARDIFLLVVNQEFAEANSQSINNRGFGFASWTRYFSPRIGLSVIGQIEYDEFTLLDRRTVFGSAVRFRHQSSPSVAVEFGTGYMYESEELDVPPDGQDEQEQRNHRWVNLLVTGFELADGKASFINSLFVMPRFDNLSDVRVLDEAELMVHITKRLSLGMSFRVKHDSRPPTGVEETDLSLASRLRYKF